MTEQSQPAEPDPISSWIASTLDQGVRIDVFLSRQFPSYSRSYVQRLIEGGHVQVDHQAVRPAYRLKPGHVVTATLPPPPPPSPVGEDIPLQVVYEDDDLIAIDKPAGMVVHPAKGHWSGTLTAALAFRFQQLSGIGGAERPGIVHRLDRDTSGLILIAKHDASHLKLARQFARRTVRKQYVALVCPPPDRDRDRIEQPIGPHPYQREKMAIRAGHPSSRPAVTRFEVRRRWTGFAQLDVFPETGRTHQIRVHLAHAGSPILCDRLYSGRASITVGAILRTEDDRIALARQALHAHSLEFDHPSGGRRMRLIAPLPADLLECLAVLDRPSGRGV